MLHSFLLTILEVVLFFRKRGTAVLYTEILKDERIFSRLYKKGSRCGGKYLGAYYAPNRLSFNRFGITAGKKIGCAVERNRAKRIIRAAYRKNELILPIGYDIVLVARPDIGGVKSDDLDGFFFKLSKDMIPRENRSKASDKVLSENNISS